MLFVATGLYVGFESALTIGYMAIGSFCCAYGVAIFVLRLRDRPRASAETRMSPDFVSVAPAHAAAAMSNNDQVPETEHSGSE